MKSNYIGYEDENKNEFKKLYYLVCFKLKDILLYVLV